MKFRTPYSGNVADVSLHFDPDSSLTQQNPAELTTIKAYLDKYQRLGILGDPQRLSEAQFGDFTSVSDYQQSLERVMRVRDAFADLPAVVRRKFDDDPQQFLVALNDPQRVDELVELGVLKKREVAVSEKVPIVAPKDPASGVDAGGTDPAKGAAPAATDAL